MADQTTEIVLGQIGTHVEPIACRSCGKSARACGRAASFCCPDCAGAPGEAGTSFTTHYPPVSSRNKED